MTPHPVAGIDLGATNLHTAIGDGTGQIIGRVGRSTPGGDGAAVEREIASALEAACTAAEVEPGALASIGIASVGPMDATVGTVLDPPNIEGAERIRLKHAVQSTTDAPVTVYNDAVAALIAEREAGAPPNTVYLTLSTGIGAGACVDGHVLEGRHGNAAEVGHTVVDAGGSLRCNCGVPGHWEAYSSGTALPAHAAHVARTTALDTENTFGELSTPEVIGLVDSDQVADRTLARVARFNAMGLGCLVHAYAPEEIVVGGTVGRAARHVVLDPAIELLPDYLAVEAPAVRVTAFEDPALQGALTAARRTARDHPQRD